MRVKQRAEGGLLAIAIVIVFSILAAPASAQAAEPDTQIDSGPADGSASTDTSVTFT